MGNWSEQALLKTKSLATWETPLDITDLVHLWDVDDASTATSAGEVTQVDDLVGSADLTDNGGVYENPLYTSSDTLLGGRAAAHIETTEDADGRALYSTAPSVSQNFTFFIIARLVDSLPYPILSDPDAGNVFVGAAEVSTVPRWSLTADGVSEIFTTNGVRATAGVHLIIVYVDDGAPTIEVDGVVCALDDTAIGTGGLSSVLIGSTAVDSPTWLWTMAGIVSGDMSSDDRANLRAWAVANAGVVVWTPDELSPEGLWDAELGHAASDGGAVSSWANQGTAGSAGDLAQGTGGNQPTYDAALAAFADQAVMTFASGGDVIYAAAGTWWHLSSESSSMCIVAVCMTSSASGFEEVVATRAYTSQGGFALRIRAASSCSFNVEESGGVTAITDSGANGTQNAVTVLAGVLTGAVTTTHDSAACWVNGVSAGATTGDLDAAVAAGANREFCVGGVATTTGALTGHIAWLMFIKRVLTAPEDELLTAYLNNRFGTSVPGVTQ